MTPTSLRRGGERGPVWTLRYYESVIGILYLSEDSLRHDVVMDAWTMLSLVYLRAYSRMGVLVTQAHVPWRWRDRAIRDID